MPVSGVGVSAEPPLAIQAVDAGDGFDGADAGGGATCRLDPRLRLRPPFRMHGEAEFIVIAARERKLPGPLRRVQCQ